MDERSQVLMATLVGAVMGGVFGCLYLTERGRQVRRELDPMFDSVINEIHRSRQTIDKARIAVEEGRRLFDDALHAPPSDAAWEPRDLHRASS